jgi:glycosyltransferase involved in cell wall biosynthesis
MGVPSIYHVHSVSIEKPEWVGRLLAEWVRLTGDILVSNSRASGDIFVRRGFPTEKCVALGNPVDFKEYNQPGAREAIRRELGIGDKPLIGLVGRIARVKSIEHFIDAAAILAGDFPEACFMVAGGPGTPDDMAYFEALKRQVEQFGLADKLIFTGRRNDIPRVMAALDVLALTSSSEGFGLVLIEAMAAGVPVVGSRVGGVVEIISDGKNGFLVPYGDPQSIAAAIRALLNDPERARQMGYAGREMVERLFAADKLAKQLEDIYLSLVARK